ncbi:MULTISPECIES: hypothetical protein [unclassified Mesorhizobium]|uniref:hypothetical protein n=1 Tax=unclassified Mesorhizobium TaxID=325217 RepID=UPI001093987C|nr:MULTISPECIES: hypothetical protein [unclassified Mesorhizobium]TGT35891.1 hypothetical protein EN808_30520 [Mesorhizobium sp. M8A.F.Ca.ET.165.01.1.1]TIS47383.1 MAG: hypothetical protein E5W96_22665 [Mesorhizobium sp.]
MRLVTTRRATNLTGLSTEQLREWSSRRALIPADIQNRGRGSQAQYGWQAILLLRIALLLKDRFHVELHAHRGLFAALRKALGTTSFIKLRGTSVAIYDCETWELIDADAADESADAIVVQLDPHLAVLAAEFTMPGPPPTGQLELFTARLVSAEPASKGDEMAAEVLQQPSRRRA